MFWILYLCSSRSLLKTIFVAKSQLRKCFSCHLNKLTSKLIWKLCYYKAAISTAISSLGFDAHHGVSEVNITFARETYFCWQCNSYETILIQSLKSYPDTYRYYIITFRITFFVKMLLYILAKKIVKPLNTTAHIQWQYVQYTFLWGSQFPWCQEY